jgi:hypothetical protein
MTKATPLPWTWWEAVFDGHMYRVDIRDTPYVSVDRFRAAAYRNAQVCLKVLATHKASFHVLVVQAKDPFVGEPLSAADLRAAAAHALPAPVSPETSRHGVWVCTCGQGPVTHAPSCRMTGYWYRGPAPAVRTDPAVEVLSDDDLLGPCTCGQAPLCTPECARAGG